MMGTYLKILAFIAIATGFWAFGSGKDACATIANQTCDTAVWTDMTQRARLETEREIMQNQNLIFKPDSILAYTCFDSMAAHAGAQAGVLFTHTEYWKPQPLKWGKTSPYVSMDKAVQTVVIDAMNTYYQSNFKHSMLGGRSNIIGASGMDHIAKAQPKEGYSYSCSMMGQVWAMAKCMNFMHNDKFANSDGFYPFLNLKGDGSAGSPDVVGYQGKDDIRHYPDPCKGNPIYNSSWGVEYRNSRNEVTFGFPNKDYNFGQRINDTFTAVRERVEPGMCGDGIKTGVKVILSPGATETFDDGVCTNPGCTYTKSGKCVGGSADAGSPSAGYK